MDYIVNKYDPSAIEGYDNRLFITNDKPDKAR